MFGFEKLEVWKKSIEYADAIYTVTRKFPDDERFGLRVQLQRAAVSISSNVAEGSSRISKKDFARFVELSYGSLMETISQLRIAQNQHFASIDKVSDLRERAVELARMLSGLKGTLLRKNQP